MIQKGKELGGTLGIGSNGWFLAGVKWKNGHRRNIPWAHNRVIGKPLVWYTAVFFSVVTVRLMAVTTAHIIQAFSHSKVVLLVYPASKEVKGICLLDSHSGEVKLLSYSRRTPSLLGNFRYLSKLHSKSLVRHFNSDLALYHQHNLSIILQSPPAFDMGTFRQLPK